MLKVEEVRVNLMKCPVGVSLNPTFSWEIQSDRKCIKQSAYELQIAMDEAFTILIFDTGKIWSDQSVNVSIEKMILEPLQRYYVRVKIWDIKEVSDFSEPASFVTCASLKQWRGDFISAEKEEDILQDKGTYVRYCWTVSKDVKEAWLCATAHGLYKAYINGEKIGDDELTPGWTSYNKHLMYQIYDVTCFLKKGENAIGAMLGSGWYKGTLGDMPTRNIFGNKSSFLGVLWIRYEDGTENYICTNSKWRGHEAPVLMADIYNGETYDANKELDGWNQTGFADDSWDDVEAEAANYEILDAQTCRTKIMNRLPVKEIIITPEGDTVLDFGQNMTGWVEFTVRGNKGDVVELNCFEILDAEGNVYRENLRAAHQTIIYVLCNTETVRFHPNFTYQGFRYVKVARWPGDIRPEQFTACVVHSDMEETGKFQCSNQELNQLHHNILWGMKSNFLDVPTDCPQRDERLGWTGDAQIFAGTACYLMNTDAFYTKWLRDVACDQTKEGGVPHVVPDILSSKKKNNWLLSQGTDSAACWADAAVIIPWNLYQMYGDQSILIGQYESMKKWIDFMASHAKDYIWNYKLQFGDWVALDAEPGSYFGATPNELTCTAYFALSTKLFYQIAEILNRKNDALTYRVLYEKIKEKFQQTFFDEKGELTAQTQTAHIVALYFGLTPDIYKQKTIEQLKKLLEKEDGHLVTGFVGTPYFCFALSQNNALKEAYDLLLKDDFPSWLYQVKMGATTIWEHWDGIKPDGTMWSPDMNSFNHYAYGAIGEWFYKTIAGICPEETGFKKIRICPRPGGNLKYAETSYHSVYGKICSSWKRNEDYVTLRVTIPANTAAKVVLKCAAPVQNTDGINFTYEGLRATAEIDSGTYEFTYQLIE